MLSDCIVKAAESRVKKEYSVIWLYFKHGEHTRFKVIAEGRETEQIPNLSAQFDSDYVQGDLFAKYTASSTV